MKSNLFHRFFHEPEKGGRLKSYSYWFERDLFYSYSTVIGCKVTGKDNQPVLLVSYFSMTPTTCRHINALTAACPYDREHIIVVPFRYGGSVYNAKRDVPELFKQFFDRFKEESLIRAPNRNEVLSMFFCMERFDKLVGKIPADTMKKAKALKEIAEAGNNQKLLREKISGVLAKREAAAIRKKKEDDRRFRKIIKDYESLPYLEKVRLACSHNSLLDLDVRLALMGSLSEGLGDKQGLSFAYIKGEVVKTSGGIEIESDTVKHLITRWKAKSLPEGSHIGPYTINEIREDYVRIGCHLIPVENIEALAVALGA